MTWWNFINEIYEPTKINFCEIYESTNKIVKARIEISYKYENSENIEIEKITLKVKYKNFKVIYEYAYNNLCDLNIKLAELGLTWFQPALL
ncbi:hypothetical protein [Muninn virus]|nr:hypothetical protein [Muninn virus]